MDKNKHKNYKKLFYIIITILVHIGYIMTVGSIAFSLGSIGAASFIIGVGLILYAFVAWIVVINLEY